MHANLNGIEHWYESHDGEGAPVLLIMGFGLPGSAWRPQVEGLRGHHRVITFDNRGCGRSGPVTGPYGMRELANDAVALLDHLDIERAHVVGVSMGGMIAQELALQHRARLRSLSLIATHHGGRVRILPTAPGLALFLRANSTRGDTRLAYLRRLLYPPGQEPAPGSLGAQMAAHFAEPIARKTALYQLSAIRSHDTRDRLESLAGLPTLVVRPDRDILVRPSHSDRLHRRIPGSRLLSFRDAGHAVTAQCAPELNRYLLAHFAEADAAGRL